MFTTTRFGAAVFAAAAISTFAGTAWADPEVIAVPGQTVTHTVPGLATPPIGPVVAGTPPISVPRTCAGTVFCAGPVDIPPMTIVNVPRIDPIGLTPTITLTVSTTNIVAAANPTVTTLITVPPQTVEIPNPFGGAPIPVDVCPTGCPIPGASVLDGATGSVTLTACVGSTCETEVVPVHYGDTSPGQVCFTQATRSAPEGSTGGLTYVTLNAQRIGGTFNDAYASYATQNGTAVASGDYHSRTGTLYWPHGEGGARQISVPIVGDTVDESDENFSVALSNFSGATPCAPTTAVVTITDDDNPPAGSLQFATGNYVVGEGGVSVNVEVVRVGGTFGTATATVSFAAQTAGSGDFVNPGPTSVTFTGSDTSETVTVFITDDAEYEPGADETFRATLGNVSGAGTGSPTTANIAIADNDPQPSTGSLQFGSSSYSVNEGGGSVTLEVVRVGGTFGTATATVSFAGQTAGVTDFVNPGPQTVTFSGTDTSETVTVLITDDAEYEPGAAETFGASLGNVSGAGTGSPSSATVAIADNDPQPPAGSLRFGQASYSVSEGGLSVLIEVVREGGTYGTAQAQVTFSDITASGTTDYVGGTRNVSFADGTGGSQTVSVTISDDTAIEGDEQFQASLTGATVGLGDPSTTVVTIVDNDQDTTPNAFGFASQGSTTRNTLITSNGVTIGGLGNGVFVSATVESSDSTVAGIDVNGDGNFQAVRSGIANGSVIRVRHLSASEFETGTTTTIRVGNNPGTTGTFYSWTRSSPGDTCPPGQICP